MRSFLALILAAAVAASLALPAGAASVSTAAAEATTTLLVGVDAASRTAVHDAAGFPVLNRIPGIGVDVVRVPKDAVSAALVTFRALPGVRYAEHNRVVRLNATPNDPYVRDQYALTRIRARGGWEDYGRLWKATGGARLAVVDSGIDMTLPEFAGKVSHCRRWLTGIGIGANGCQDTMFHGTHVAGIAAARTNNRNGIAGVAFDSPIMALQAFNSTGTALTADIAAAIVYAANNGARAANYSFSADEPSSAEREAVAYARRRGVVQVGAAGNTGEAGIGYPAGYTQVIAVSATNARDQLAGFSSYGRGTEIAAPGAAVLSTFPGGLYAELDGTSMAAPHVAGLAAMLRAQGYGPKGARERIRSSADDLGPAGRDIRYGYGRINMRRALD